MKSASLLTGLVVFLTLTALSPGSVLTVNTETDEADTPAGAALSLREAVRDAASGDVIVFAATLSGRALMLTRGEMTITDKTLTVDGSALAGGLTLSAQHASRHFQVTPGGALTINALTLAKGLNGAVLNAGAAALTNCIVRECRNGAIHNTGTFTATGTKFFFNEAEPGQNGTMGANVNTTSYTNYPPPGAGGNGTGGADGGAIRSTGPLTITNCWFHANKAGTGGTGGLGGRVFYSPGFGGSQILQNGPWGLGAYGGGGGAIWQAGPCTISGSTFSENQAGPGGGEGDASGRHVSGGRGGAIYYAGGASPAVITNSTFTGNSVSIGQNPGAVGQAQSAARLEGGGALYVEAGTLRLVHVTVAGNLNVMTSYTPWANTYTPVVAKSAGVLSSGQVEVANSIIAQNPRQKEQQPNATWEVTDFAGPPASFAFQAINLLGTPGDPATLTDPGSPLTGTFAQPLEPVLSELVFQGGLTPVRVPLSASPALGQGQGPLPGAATDQRGLSRSPPVDLGSVETQPAGEPAGLSAQTLTFTQPPTQFYTGTNVNVNLSATASSGLTPVFSVVAGPATVSGSTLTIIGRGTVHVKASQPGNGIFAAADPVTWPISVTKLQQTLSFTGATLYYRGVNLTQTLFPSASSGLPVALTFLSGPGSLNGTTLTGTGIGTILVRADQAGNASYDPAPPVTATFTVQWDRPVVTAGNFTQAAGIPFSRQVSALYNPDSFSANGLPPGLSINTSTGLVSGTPSAPGDYAASVSATNASGTGSATWQFSITRPAPVAGETMVTTLNDELDSPAGAFVSLREAMRDTASGGTIRFHAGLSGGTAFLPVGFLTAGGKELTITAEALAGGIKISGVQTTRILSLAKYDLLHLRGLEFQNGRSARGAGGFQGADAPLGYDLQGSSGGPGEAGGNGGAIYNLGALDLWRCTFRGNRTGNGGDGGRAGRVGGPTFTTYGGRGGDGGQGGAIFNATGATLTADECLFVENSGGGGGTGGSLLFGSFSAGGEGGSGGDGGAIASAGSLTLRACTFSANLSGTGGLGGEGSHSYPSHGRPGSGGAISAGAATLVNCTFHGNSTPAATPWAFSGNPNDFFWETFTHRPGTGGALSVQSGKAIHCTFAANFVPLQTFTPANLAVVGGKGGGVSAGSAFTLENCLLAGNTAPFPDFSDLTGTPVLTAANFFSIRGTTAGPLNGTVAAPLDARLLPLANYGGFTPTLPLDRSSPARNAAIATADTPALDQRGLPRVQGPAADPGAYEWDEPGYLALARPDFQFRRQGASSSIRWQMQSGYLYSLLESPNLQPPWQSSNLTITVDANGEASCLLPLTGTRRFYTLGISPAP